MDEENVQQKRKHLAALDEFIKSPAFAGYKAAVEAEIKANHAQQVAIIPDSFVEFVELLMVKGELRVLESRINMFEDARTTLGQRIDEMVEAELESANTTRQ